MKYEQLKIEEIETSQILGGCRRCRSYSVVRYFFSWSLLGKVWFRKKTMDLCGYESEENTPRVGDGVNTI